jgi:hypothetical protein
MFTNEALLPQKILYPLRCSLFFLATCLWVASAAAKVTVTASKDCSTTPCSVMEASFTTVVAQTITWSATYNGGPTDGHSFYLTTSPNSNLADIPLTTSGQPSGSYFLQPGTYYISINLGVMGPGFYSVTYGPTSSGEPHITTTNGMHYNFQGVGEFVWLHNDAMEIQVRQAPIPTTYNPPADPHDELATCVSINTAVAARVGKHRVTYEPNLTGVPDPGGLQLRVDGVLAFVGPIGIDLGDGARITRTLAPGGLEIDFPDGSNLFVTPTWWDFLSIWYLDIDALPAQDALGIAGSFKMVSRDAPENWLPSLPDGSSIGPMPSSLHDRFVALYQKFTDAWRVTAATSLFDYAPGTSTDTFTLKTWPPEQPPCSLPGKIAVDPLPLPIAKQLCRSVITENDNCVYDVAVTGNAGFATSYAIRQGLQVKPPPVKPCNMTLLLILSALLLLALILLLICVFRR